MRVSWLDLLIAVALIVVVYFVIPKVVVPALARRRGTGTASRQVTPKLAAVIAALVAVSILARAWSGDLGQPAVAAIVLGCLGVAAYVLWASRSRRG